MISSEIGKEIIKRELPLVPKLPGVYRMLNDKGDILYVGKAKNLPNRLKSYVTEKNHIIRTGRMLSQTRKLEITTTSNESEALLLEANLIKKYKPKFNILLRDDKSFPFIFISNKDIWPQIKRHRGKKTKEGFYFGPFASAGSANWTIKMIQKIFHLRVCDDTVFKNRERPCILYQIKRCSGPCVGYVEKEEYKKTVDDAVEFVSGKSRKIQKSLSDQMERASENLDFEKAVILRDRIKSLNIIQSSQRINEANLIEADVIAGYKESGKTCIQVFFYRSKQNWGNQAFFPKHDPDEKLGDIINSFVAQFYENKSVPSSIILSEEIKEKILIEKTLSKKEDKQINISVAKKGSKLKVINQAIKNAKDSLNRKLYESQNNRELFDSVASKFNLETNINLIEVYDNSHIQGTNSVGALITYGDKVIKVLEKIKNCFDSKNRSVSIADLIVLSGNVAVEKAAINAGHKIKVPFLQGRGDAKQDQTDIFSFNLLEPKADGFVNYQKIKSSTSPEEMLIDKAQLMQLSGPEMTVLIGGMRVLGTNFDGSNYGVFTKKIGTLTNDYFKNLLDMNITWSAKDKDEQYFQGKNRKTNKVLWEGSRVDLIFGSNSQLRAIAEVYASDDSKEKFVKDFVKVWSKVMNLDRFDKKLN